MLFTKEEIDAALDLDQKSQNKETATIEHTGGFGGRFDIRLLESEEEAWVLYHSNIIAPPIKILISAPLNCYPLDSTEKKFFDSLKRQNYEIYVWKGLLVGPIADLWEHLQYIQPKTKQELEDLLNKQEKSIHDFEVLDQSRYEDVVTKLAKKKGLSIPGFSTIGIDYQETLIILAKIKDMSPPLNLPKESSKKTRFLHANYVDHVVRYSSDHLQLQVNANDVEGTSFDFSRYNVFRVDILEASNINELKLSLSTKTLVISCLFNASLNLDLSNTSLQYLELIDACKIEKLLLPPTFQRLSLQGTQEINCSVDLSALPMEELLISDWSIFRNMRSFRLPATCERFKILDSAEISFLDLTETHLRYLKVRAKMLFNMGIPHTCEELNLNVDDLSLQSLNLYRTQLQKIAITTRALKEYPVLPQICKEFKLKITTANNQKVDLSSYPLLKKVTIANIEWVIFPSTLLELKIKNIDLSKQGSDFSKTLLQKITISACQNLDPTNLKLPSTCTELILEEISYIENVETCGFYLANTSLQKIVINNNKQTKYNIFIHIPSSCRELELKKATVIFFNKMSNMEFLSLTDCSILSLNQESNIFSIFPNLLSLRLCSIGNTSNSDSRFRHISDVDIRTSKLEKIELNSCESLYIDLAKHPHLRILQIRECNDVTTNNLDSTPFYKLDPLVINAPRPNTQATVVTTTLHSAGQAAPSSLSLKPCFSRAAINKSNQRGKTIPIDEESYACCLYRKGRKQKTATYRIAILDKIDTNARFSSTILESDLTDMHISVEKLGTKTFAEEAEKCKDENELVLGTFKCIHQPRDSFWCPLPSLRPCSEKSLDKIYSNVPGIKILWHKENRQYYYQIPNSNKPITLQLIYTLQQPTAKEYPEIEYLLTNPDNLLPSNIKKHFESIITTIPKLYFLFNPSFTTKEKLENLTQFFLKFQDQQLDPNITASIDVLTECLKREMGACLERAMLFTICTRIIGIRSCLLANGIHAVSQCCCKIDNENNVITYNFSGSLPPPAPKEAQKFTLSDAAEQTRRSNIANNTATYAEITINEKLRVITFWSTNSACYDIVHNIEILQSVKCDKDLLCVTKTNTLHNSKIAKILRISPEESVPLGRIIAVWRVQTTTALEPEQKLSCLSLVESHFTKRQLFGLPNELYHQCLLMIILHHHGIAARLKIDNQANKIWIEIPCVDTDKPHDATHACIKWKDLDEVFPPPMKAKKITNAAPIETATSKALLSALITDAPAKAATSSTTARSLATTCTYSREEAAIAVLMNPESFFSQRIMVKRITSFEQLCTIRNPLIVTNNPLDINTAILNNYVNLGGNARKHVFINSPRDFRRLFNCRVNGQAAKIDGPLKWIIEKEGVIVINWSNFKPNEIAYYSSLLDKIPTLFGQSVNKNVFIINLMTQTTEASGAFSSRCTKIDLQLAPEAIDHESRQETININLFAADDWKDKIFGKRQFKERQIVSEPSLLEAAIAQNKDLVVYNKPNDPDFNDFIYRINEEHKYFIDGHLIVTPNNFRIKTVAEPKPIATPTNIDISMDVNDLQGKRKLYLNIPSHYEFLERFKVSNSNGTAQYIDGLLAKYKDGDVIYVTESIPQMIWWRLMDEINTKHPGKHFKFVLAPEVEITDVAKNEQKRNQQSSNPSVYVSSDPDFCAEHLREQNKDSIIIPITPHTNFGNLIKYVETTDNHDGTYNFNRKEQAIIQAIKAGNKVILNGMISTTLYQQLLKYIDNGQVILVISKPTATKINPLAAQEINYTWEDYEKHIDAIDRENFNKLKIFYYFGRKMQHLRTAMPKELVLSFSCMQMCLEKLRDKSPKWHLQNPLKSVIHNDYERNTEEYAYLNVLSKILFARGSTYEVRINKLQRLLQKYKIATSKMDWQQIQQCRWQLLNCFSSEKLHQIFLDINVNGIGKLESHLDFSKSPPGISEQVLDSLLNHVMSTINSSTASTTTSTSSATTIATTTTASTALKCPHTKAKEQLEDSLTTHKSTVLIGDTGTGKTETIKALAGKYEIHYGIKEIESCLTPKSVSGKPRILVLNEGNLKPDGYWDFLKGIATSSKQIEYKGNLYQVPEDLRIVVTGNPISYTGRNMHDFFQKYAHKIWVSPLNDEGICKKILEPILKNRYPIAWQNKLLTIYKELPNYIEQTSTFRDLKSLAWRFVMLNQLPNSCYQNSLYQACVAEFAYGISDVNKRKKFLQKMAEVCEIPNVNTTYTGNMRQLPDNVVVPPSHQQLVSIIEQDLSLREHSEIETKSILLLVGSSGLGKSTILRAILKEHGITADAKNPENRYYEITGKGQNTQDLIKKAAKEGSVVVFDEWNVNEEEGGISFEDFINNLLDQLGDEKMNPKFRILASQNRAGDLGRSTASKADTNRVHYLHYADYDKPILVAIAYHYLKNIKKATAYVEDFTECRSRPATLQTNLFNERNFFEGLKEIQAFEQSLDTARSMTST